MKKKLLPVVILAGGLATRLRPVTTTIPKALININGEPFINHQLRLLSSQGIQDVILCISYLGELIEQHVADGHRFGLHVQHIYDGETLLGTAGAIKKALPLLGNAFFVLYGDSYLACNYAAIQDSFIKSKKQGLMTLFHNQGLLDTSNVEYQNGEIITYDKKERNDRMNYIDYGLGIFSRQAFDLVPQDKYFDLALLYQTLLRHQQLAAHEVDKRFYEVGSFAGIKELEYDLKQD
jgi:N-acetyl-alpha-D-muramate 1-phosphate uridylyltransferase